MPLLCSCPKILLFFQHCMFVRISMLMSLYQSFLFFLLLSYLFNKRFSNFCSNNRQNFFSSSTNAITYENIEPPLGLTKIFLILCLRVAPIPMGLFSFFIRDANKGDGQKNYREQKGENYFPVGQVFVNSKRE